MSNLSYPEIKISCISNVYVRLMHFKKAGDVELGHKHYYDHATLLSSGSLRVRVYDEEKKEFLPEKIFSAPRFIFISKNYVHELTAIEDNTIACCIHALRNENEEIIEPDMFPVPTSIAEAVEKYSKKHNKLIQQFVNYHGDEHTSKRNLPNHDIFKSF